MKRFNTEGESIQWLTSFLHSRGFTSVKPTQSDDIYCHTDLYALTPDGRRVAFEIKRRNFPSTRFGDQICEGEKVVFVRDAVSRGEISAGYLVSLFDDVACMADLSTPGTYRDRVPAHHTTEFEDKTLVIKEFVHFPQTLRFSYSGELLGRYGGNEPR